MAGSTWTSDSATPSWESRSGWPGGDPLAFAGVVPASVLALPRARRFAEKVHAYTFPWVGRTNTRDLMDIVLMIDRGTLPPTADLRAAVVTTSERRNTHRVPADLPPPPAARTSENAAMAADVRLPSAEMTEGFTLVAAFPADRHLT
jgi:hypothetical protein